MKTPQTQLVELGWEYKGQRKLNDQNSDLFIKQSDPSNMETIILFKGEDNALKVLRQTITNHDIQDHAIFVWGQEPVRTAEDIPNNL